MKIQIEIDTNELLDNTFLELKMANDAFTAAAAAEYATKEQASQSIGRCQRAVDGLRLALEVEEAGIGAATDCLFSTEE